MKYPEFKLENYLTAREFSAPFNLCASDLETYTMSEVIQMADTESLQLWDKLQLSYTEPRGLPELLNEISELYGPDIAHNNILCFAGAEEGIYSMAHALLEPNDHAIIVTPCYQSLEAIPSTLCSTTAVALRYQEQWSLDIGLIEAAIRPNTKLLVINFPHNPTGALLTREQQQALVQLARKHGIWIFSDEVYRLLELDPADRLPPIASVYEKGISLGVMSKAYGLAGLRVGWIACQDLGMIEKIGEVKHYLSICNSAPSEILSLMALRASEKILARNTQLMRENLALFDRFFEEQAEWFEWIRPKGACIGYPLFKSKKPIDELAEELLKEFGVLIIPSSVYDHSENHFRVSFGRKNAAKALGLFSQYIEKNKGKWSHQS